MSQDLITHDRLNGAQIATLVLMMALNALDGFDIQSIAFAAPGIAREWGIERTALGVVLSIELIGMSVGSIFIGGLADRFGRRPTILTCLIFMTGGMFLASTSDSVTALCAWRLLTGLGIGGMLTAITAMTAETSPAKSRELFVALMTIGYPVGSVIGGAIAANMLTHSDWRSVFLLGAGASALVLPLAFFFVAESPAFLAMNAKPGALEKLNAGLTKLGQAPLEALPPKIEKNKSPFDIFKPHYIGPTLLITGAYFAHVFAMYFLLKWTPKVVSDLGYATSEAAGVLVYANVGNAIGGALFGLTAAFLPLKARTIFVIAMTGVMLSVFGRSGASLTALTISATAVGFFVTSGTAGLFTFFTRVFPPHLRTTGTGFVIGVGRGGGALSPIFAGFLFEHGLTFPIVASIMGCGSFLAAALLLMLNVKAHDDAPAAVKNAA